jgi:hypothetical protein
MVGSIVTLCIGAWLLRLLINAVFEQLTVLLPFIDILSSRIECRGDLLA